MNDQQKDDTKTRQIIQKKREGGKDELKQNKTINWPQNTK